MKMAVLPHCPQAPTPNAQSGPPQQQSHAPWSPHTRFASWQLHGITPPPLTHMCVHTFKAPWHRASTLTGAPKPCPPLLPRVLSTCSASCPPLDTCDYNNNLANLMLLLVPATGHDVLLLCASACMNVCFTPCKEGFVTSDNCCQQVSQCVNAVLLLVTGPVCLLHCCLSGGPVGVAPQFSLATPPDICMMPVGLPYAPLASYAHFTDIVLCCCQPCACPVQVIGYILGWQVDLEAYGTSYGLYLGPGTAVDDGTLVY